MNDRQCPNCMVSILNPVVNHVNVWWCDECGTLLVGSEECGNKITRVTRVEQLNRAGRCREVLKEWVSKQGHDRCWYYPDLFNQLCKILCVDAPIHLNRPSRKEFEFGCERFQDEEYREVPE